MAVLVEHFDNSGGRVNTWKYPQSQTYPNRTKCFMHLVLCLFNVWMFIGATRCSGITSKHKNMVHILKLDNCLVSKDGSSNLICSPTKIPNLTLKPCFFRQSQWQTPQRTVWCFGFGEASPKVFEFGLYWLWIVCNSTTTVILILRSDLSVIYHVWS